MPPPKDATSRASVAAGTEVEPEALGGRVHHRSSAQAGVVEKWAGPALLVVLFVVFALALPSKFPTYNNLIAITNNQTITAIIALGLLFPLAAGVFDISIGGMFTVSLIISTSLFQGTGGHIPVVVVVVITLLCALLAGLFNALLVVKLKIDPFIVTLGSGSVFLGLSQLIARGKVISEHIPSSFTDLGRHRLVHVPLPVVYVGVVAAVIWYVLGLTPFGRYIYATGAGRDAARLAGVPTDRALYVAFIVSAVGASVAALLYAARIGTGQPDAGGQYLLPAYAAAFLGSTMVRPGRFNVPGLFVGLALLAVGINGLELWGIPFWVIDTFQGAALIIAVVVTKVRRRVG